MEGRVVDTGHVAGTGWLVFFGFEAEGVHVDALRWHVFVMLIWLNEVKVTAIPFGEPVVAIELEFREGNRVLAILEGDWDEHVVGTTRGDTRHGARFAIARRNEGRAGAGPSTAGGIGVIVAIGVVEPLFAVGSRVTDIVIGLYYPYQLLHRVIKVQFNLVVGVAGAFVTSELELFDQVLVGDLSETSAFVGIEVDVIDEEGSRRQ